MGGVAYIAATIAEPGVIVHTGQMARLRFGAVAARTGGRGERLSRGVQGCWHRRRAGRRHSPRAVGEVRLPRCLSGVTSATRQPIGAIRADPDLRACFEARDAAKPGRCRRARVVSRSPTTWSHSRWHSPTACPPQMKSSMLNDLVAGNRLEAPWLSGAVARMAKEAGLAAPVNATLYAAVKPFVDGTR